MLGQRKKNVKDSKLDTSKKQWELELESEDKAPGDTPAPDLSENDHKSNQIQSENEEKTESRGPNQSEKIEQVQKKTKKYEWMDSDDDIEIQTDSDEIKSEKQEPVVKEKEVIQKSSDKRGDALTLNSDDRDTRTIFISNLPFDLSNKEIDNLFKKYGKIISMEVPKNEGSIVNKGRAFIEYSTVEEAQKAVNSKTLWAKGRELQVTLGLSNATMAQPGKKTFPAKRSYKSNQRSSFQDKRQRGGKRKESSGKSYSRSRSRSNSSSRKRRSSSSSSSSSSSRSRSNSSGRSSD